MNHRITAIFATAAALALSAGAALADDQAPAPAAPAPAPAPATAPAAAAAPAPPAPPSLMPAMTSPLAQNPTPMSVDLGPLGSKVYITGAVSGLAYTQNHRVAGDKDSYGDLSNAQIFINKVDGEFQYFVDVGAYSLPALGNLPYTKATTTTSNTYDIMPLAYVKYAPAALPGFSIQAGKLPTLIGDEYMFTIENSNIERGLVWNTEPLVSRGVQVNYSQGPVTVNVAWTDGYYSNDYNTISGALTYVLSPTDTFILQGEGPTSKSSRISATTTPLFNNSTLYDLIWTHTMGPWSFTPYLQYTTSPAYFASGTTQDTTTWSVAVLGTYTFDSKSMLSGVSIPARFEYISQNNGTGVGNVLFGPGSNAYSFTITPTYTFGHYFVRGEASYVNIGSGVAGFGYGLDGTEKDQVRGMLELGVLF